ncbi:unnamed protein product [Nezara viridula]|uniref:Uncharacterized protein n=1 Tax=Nezara viridula TaxID=85310 RepID=A0A9P0HM98_NEZVI|nr:unnamed protein product [Nezara viridula]
MTGIPVLYQRFVDCIICAKTPRRWGSPTLHRFSRYLRNDLEPASPPSQLSKHGGAFRVPADLFLERSSAGSALPCCLTPAFPRFPYNVGFIANCMRKFPSPWPVYSSPCARSDPR